MLQVRAVYCRLVQCVAGLCSVLQGSAVSCSMLIHMARHGGLFIYSLMLKKGPLLWVLL